ncbi:hypothetical protein NL676_033553 [Syzygium grande]|nr:hypothetical protein NL676_033553 [Syzygium grande]
MDSWTGLLAVVDWWITMLHVMIALGRTCVCKCSVISNIDGATVGATRASSVVVKVVWSRDGATVGRSRA